MPVVYLKPNDTPEDINKYLRDFPSTIFIKKDWDDLDFYVDEDVINAWHEQGVIYA